MDHNARPSSRMQEIVGKGLPFELCSLTASRYSLSHIDVVDFMTDMGGFNIAGIDTLSSLNLSAESTFVSTT
jgi:hypothetical protein